MHPGLKIAAANTDAAINTPAVTLFCTDTAAVDTAAAVVLLVASMLFMPRLCISGHVVVKLAAACTIAW